MMREQFSEHVRKVMQVANREAMCLGCDYIGTEHVLLAIVDEDAGLAGRLLRSLGVVPKRLRQLAEKTAERGTPRPRMSEVVGYAIEEARDQNHAEIATEHLLLALV